DEHGHLAGDRILRGVASRLRAEVNPEDVLARYGGEEFAVVLVETPNEEARQRAERFRQRVQDRPFEFEGRRVSLTISLGIAT
ncbi:GGDEF domain-containing protein, partial [Staphylococcus aureus]